MNLWKTKGRVWYQKNDDSTIGKKCFKCGSKESRTYESYKGESDDRCPKQEIDSCQMHKPGGWRRKHD